MTKRPPGHHTVTPGMICPNVAKVITFLEATFGAEQVEKMEMGGHIAHAEVKIGDCVVMMGEPLEKWPAMPGTLSVYVDDVDATYAKAIAAGGESLQEPADQFYGHRTARVKDPGGNHWSIHKLIEDVSKDEMQRRMMEMSKQWGMGG
jgi:uncharacterized glyoxalase superfamily protein PhnB